MDSRIFSIVTVRNEVTIAAKWPMKGPELGKYCGGRGLSYCCLE
jgi:hypothetical protein